MDISKIVPNERAVDITLPLSEEKVMTVTLLSIDDDKMKQAKVKIRNKLLSLEKRNKSFKASDEEENNTELLITAMTGWSWEKDADFKGEKLPFNEKNAKLLLKELCWFEKAIMEAVSDETAFFQS